ncbi:IS701 family transposase [Actinacidiphila sp. bgisy167]|uniref:IS701 family transposase n=1 Tax=Actinacidiphila sp. bgisy167 TaxID=3413797 RepID=UPI003D71D1F7
MAALHAAAVLGGRLDNLEISEFCQTIFSSFARADQRRWGELYVRGLLHVDGRKTIRRIAGLGDGRDPIQSLQQFVNQSPWAWAPVRRELAALVYRELAPRAWLVRDVAFAKNGTDSVGVDRQFAPSEGRVLNCQSALAVEVAGDLGSVPVNWRLMLTRKWDEGPLRAKANVPPGERSQPRRRHLLDAVDEMMGDWRLRPLPLVGHVHDRTDVAVVVRGLESRGLMYLLRVPAGTPLRSGARPNGPQTLADLVGLNPEGDRTRLLRGAERRGGRTQDVYTMTALPRSTGFGEPFRDGLPLLHRRVLHRVSPDPARAEYWVTNLDPSGMHEPLALLRMADRHADSAPVLAERTGLQHFEGRSFRGWHHHVTLASAAQAALLLSQALDDRTIIRSSA